MPQQKERNIISDKLVIEKMNKPMEEWFSILDKMGAPKMKHIEIFNLISNIEELKPLQQWNHNLLATTYEWNRGLKERGQKEDGFEISVSKTVSVPVAVLYNPWIDEKERNKWLSKEKITITKATQNKSLRAAWSDNNTRLSVDFYTKDGTKAQVVVQHLKLAGSKQAAQLKTFWSHTLEK